MSTTPFPVLMQQAAGLRTAKQAAFRKKFDGHAPWYQHSFYLQLDKLIDLRRAGNFEKSMKAALEYKAKGNDIVSKKLKMPTAGLSVRGQDMAEDADDVEFKAHEAVSSYESALSLFSWLRPTSENWQREDIDDTKMVAETLEPTDDGQRNELRSLRLSCYLNLAHCYLKLREWRSCIAACAAALELDQGNVKALYRRAQARTLPASAGGVEQNLALADLKKAAVLAPTNSDVHSALIALKREIAAQRQRDRKALGFLEKSSSEPLIDDHDNDGKGEGERAATEKGEDVDAPVPNGRGASSSCSSSSESGKLSVRDVLTQARDMESAAERMRRDGNEDAALRLMESAKETRGIMDSYIAGEKENVGLAPNAKFDDFPPDMDEDEAQYATRIAHRMAALGKEGKGKVVDRTQGKDNVKEEEGKDEFTHTLYTTARYQIDKEDAVERAQKVVKDCSVKEQVDMLRRRLTFEAETVDEELMETARDLVRRADASDPTLDGMYDALIDMLCCDLAGAKAVASNDTLDEAVYVCLNKYCDLGSTMGPPGIWDKSLWIVLFGLLFILGMFYFSKLKRQQSDFDFRNEDGSVRLMDEEGVEFDL